MPSPLLIDSEAVLSLLVLGMIAVAVELSRARVWQLLVFSLGISDAMLNALVDRGDKELLSLGQSGLDFDADSMLRLRVLALLL